MVLLMCREYKRIKHLAAAYSGVVTKVGIDKPCAVFKLAVRCHNKAHSLAPVRSLRLFVFCLPAQNVW